MKKTHLALLLVTAILALSSAYSLAAINQVYNIGFEWYSQLNSRYESGLRDISRDRCILPPKQLDIRLAVIDGQDSLQVEEKGLLSNAKALSLKAMGDYIYIYSSLGNVSSPEYRIKIVDIAQRGSNIEIKVSVNTPAKAGNVETDLDKLYRPEDMVRVKKTAFPAKGRLYVIFKNQNGSQLKEQYCEVS